MLPADKSWTIDELSSRTESVFEFRASILELDKEGIKADSLFGNLWKLKINFSRIKLRN
jgi:hypothetical protein